MFIDWGLQECIEFTVYNAYRLGSIRECTVCIVGIEGIVGLECV